MAPRLQGWIVVLLLGSVAVYAIAEEITLTTYYPSPRGVYQELRTAGNVQLGTVVSSGLSAPPRLHVLGDGTGPAFRVDDQPLPAGVTNPTPGDYDPTPFVIDQSGNVGIGTVPPATGAAKLEVAGNIKTTGICIGSDCRTILPSPSQSVVFSTPGSYKWTVPVGVSQITVEVWGAGGAGGGARGCDRGASGGGGGGYAKDTFSVSAGSSLAITVGAGGAGTIGVNAGTDGGSSSFGTLLSATGGGGGIRANISPDKGGAGGIGSPTTAITASGQAGSGMDPDTNAPGAGGAAGGPDGGAGGTGGWGSINGKAGIAPGGGGTGGWGNGDPNICVPFIVSGVGAPGRVSITW